MLLSWKQATVTDACSRTQDESPVARTLFHESRHEPGAWGAGFEEGRGDHVNMRGTGPQARARDSSQTKPVTPRKVWHGAGGGTWWKKRLSADGGGGGRSVWEIGAEDSGMMMDETPQAHAQQSALGQGAGLEPGTSGDHSTRSSSSSTPEPFTPTGGTVAERRFRVSGVGCRSRVSLCVALPPAPQRKCMMSAGCTNTPHELTDTTPNTRAHTRT